ncbi:PrsW family glutamic-type intramembrane protease [Streptomyces sp. B6B3]|uniref:CdiA C-terminal domain-containing protein n=1 Tax=Streptomyces sp. B6B3 TaxID=3153570 RepID=UPI00325DE28C
MGLVMVGAAVYCVLQLAVVAWPVRATRLSTVLLAFVVGVYGSGVLVLLFSLGWWRIAVEAGGVPEEVTDSLSRSVAPVAEEVAKAVPLLLAACFLSVRRRQWGLADWVVLGAAVGSGFGLLETLLNNPPDPNSLTSMPDGGWMGQAGLSLNAAYYPSVEEVLFSWLPSSTGVVEIGLSWDGTIGTVRHVPWGVLDGLAVGLLVRSRGWRRALAVAPLGAAIWHHWAVNNGYDAVGWADDLLVPTAMASLLGAVVVDWRALRWGKATVPGVLLAGERPGRAGALIGAGNCHLPYTALGVSRFVRARRGLLYAAARTRTEDLHRIEPLRQAVGQTAALLDHAHEYGRWDPARIRAARRAARRRRWPLLAIPLLLALPALLYLAAGNFPSTHALGEWFTRSPGTWVLFGCAAASLAFTLVVLVLLVRAWRPTRAQPLGEPVAALGFRILTGAGGVIAGGWLLYIRLVGTPLDAEIVDTDRASLIAALDNFLFYLGLALFAVGLFALCPPGALAFAGITGGAATGGAVLSATAINASLAAGVLGVGTAIAYNEVSEGGGGPSSGSSSTGGRKGRIDESEKRFNPEEREIADLLASEGRSVKALKESTTPGVRTPDALVDGVRTEFKTLSPNAGQNAINNNLNKAKHQAREAIINASRSDLTEAQARQGLERFLRNNVGRMDSIRIIGRDYNIIWP